MAVHPECAGRRQRLIEPAQFSGMSPVSGLLRSAAPRGAPPAALLRPLAEHEQLAGGGW